MGEDGGELEAVGDTEEGEALGDGEYWFSGCVRCSNENSKMTWNMSMSALSTENGAIGRDGGVRLGI